MSTGSRRRPQSGDERCPNCNSVIMPGAVLCPICGLDFRTGRVLLNEFGERRKLPLGAILGPLGAIAIVVGAIWLWRSGVLHTLSEKTAPTPKAEREAAQPSASVPSRPARSEEVLRGGTVSGERRIPAGGGCASMTEDVVIPSGATFRVEKGAIVVSEKDVAVIVTGGSLVLEGTDSEPVLLAVPVIAEGPGGELRARNVFFAKDVELAGSGICFVERSTFAGGLRLKPAEPARKTEWIFERCEFCAPEAHRPCVEIFDGVPADKLRIVLRSSNIFGRISGELGTRAAVGLGRNYWQMPPKEALSGLAGGRPEVEPAAPTEFEPAGASTIFKLQDILCRAGLVRAGANPLGLPTLGLEIDCPAGWRPAGEGVLLPPARFSPARIQIELRRGDPLPVRVRLRMMSELASGGAKDLKATDGEVVQLGEREAFDFTCSYSGADDPTRWARRCIVMSIGQDACVLTLSARESDLRELSSDLLAVARSVRFVGSR